MIRFSVADEIGKLDQLSKAGSITEDEFARLRARLVQWQKSFLGSIVATISTSEEAAS